MTKIYESKTRTEEETHKSTIDSIIKLFIIFVAVLFMVENVIELLTYLESPWREIVAFFSWAVIAAVIFIRWDKWVHERNERKKPQIIDEIKYAIIPLITQLETEISLLKERYYRYQPFPDKISYLKTFPAPLLPDATNITKEIAIERLRNERRFFWTKKFGSKIDARNKLVKALEEALGELTDRLRPEVENTYPPLVELYNSTVGEGKDRITLEARYAIDPIIDNRKELRFGNHLKDFWKIHREELLKLRELPNIKEQIEVVDSIGKELESLSHEMREYLKQLKKRYINMGLLSDDIKGA